MKLNIKKLIAIAKDTDIALSVVETEAPWAESEKDTAFFATVGYNDVRASYMADSFDGLVKEIIHNEPVCDTVLSQIAYHDFIAAIHDFSVAVAIAMGMTAMEWDKIRGFDDDFGDDEDEEKPYVVYFDFENNLFSRNPFALV